jgi:large subunit ribosomal protein L10
LAYVTRVRPEKQAVVEQLREWIAQSKGMVFFSFEELTSKDMQAMRADMKRSGLTVKVVKNTLL